MIGKLYISDVQADLDEISFSIDIFAKDIDNFLNKSTKTNTINLPGTATNRMIFDFLETTISEKTTALKSGRLEVNGLIIKGKIKEFSATKSGENINYKIQLIGNSGDWVKDIEGLKLNELDFSADDHTYDKDTMDASETYDLSLRKYMYPVINYGETIDGDTLRLVERYPAISIQAIVDKIFNEQGYTISGNFRGLLERLFLPYTQSGKKDNLTDEVLEDLLFNAGLSAVDTDTDTVPGSATNYLVSLALSPIAFDLETGALFDNGNNFNNLTHKYILDADRTLNFKADIDIVVAAPAAIIHNASKSLPKEPTVVAQIKNGTTVIAEETKTLSFNVTTTETFNLETNYMAFDEGDEITVHISLDEYVDNEDPTTNEYSLTVSTTSRFYNASLDWYGYGDEILMSNILPETLQTDFLKSLFTLWNVNPLTNVHTKEVILNSSDEFYSADTWDWSDKLIEGIETIKPIPKTFRLQLATDSNDKWAEFRINENKELSGNYDYEVSEPDSERIIKTGFSPTMMETWSTLGFRTDVIPKLWSNVPDADETASKWTTKFNLRILYFVEVATLQNSETWIFKTAYRKDMTTDKQETRDTFPEFVSFKESDGINYYFNDYFGDGMYDKYWKNELTRINNNMLMIGNFLLRVNDMQGIIDSVADRDLRTLIFLNQEGLRGNYEIIDLKDYDFKDIVKVKLLKR